MKNKNRLKLNKKIKLFLFLLLIKIVAGFFLYQWINLSENNSTTQKVVEIDNGYTKSQENTQQNQNTDQDYPKETFYEDPEEWGVAKQISDYTWTMKVGQDEKMATPEEIYDALNKYREIKGVNTLTWDSKLAEFAKNRADYFISTGELDEHAGFREYVESGDNMINMGFYGMGENSSIGFQLSGVHIIEWIFAGDPPHDNNQLDPSWTHVGIGVNSTAVNLIFGKK